MAAKWFLNKTILDRLSKLHLRRSSKSTTSSPSLDNDSDKRSVESDGDGDGDGDVQHHHQEMLIRKVFSHFDVNGDGKISAFELRSYFGSIGEHMSHEDVQAVIDEIDTDGDKLLGFEDFCKLMRKPKDGEVNGDENEEDGDLKMAFEMFEYEKGSGCITAKGLQKMLNGLGDEKKYCYDDCVAMIRVFDIDGNGVVDFHEFHRMMTRTT